MYSDKAIQESIDTTITINSKGQPVVSSLAVAKSFHKQHKHVLRDILDLEVPKEFNRSNFGPISYVDQMGREKPAIEMTRKGFVLLVMGYRGARAMAFKIAYIEAFDRMERELLSGQAAMDRVEGVLDIVARACRSGYTTSFIPDLVKYRRMGLSYEKCATLLRVCASTAHKWSRLLGEAGVDITPRCDTGCSAPRSRRETGGMQLSLFGQEAH